METRIRPRARRNGFTIPNPFITDDIKVIDIDNLTVEQKAMPIKKYDYSFIRQPQFEHLFTFAWIEYKRNREKDDDTTAEQTIAERAFFKDYECAKKFFEIVRDTDFIDYFCFKYEKGKKTGLLHLQGFMRYKKAMDMKQAHAFFPTIHLDPSYGTNHECRDYCMKSDTSIDGYDFYEYGNFVEERQRTDLNGLIDDIINNVPYEEMLRKYPHQMINMGDKVEKTRQNLLREKFKNIERKIHTTYIYGAEGTGKTTFVNRVLGLQFQDVFKVSHYDHSGKYDTYACQDVMLFDEFYGQIKLTEINDILNTLPFILPCRFNDKIACYNKVFFTSNYPLADQYKDVRAKGQEPSYKGFLRRINEIIYIPEQNLYIWQKGEPTAEVIAKLDEQGAKYLIDSPTEQMKIKGVQ